MKRLYGYGFTRKVIEYLNLEEQMRKWLESIGVKWSPDDYYRGVATAEQLIKVAEMIPKANLRDRQNDSPTFRTFLEVAKREPRALFELYVITEVRPDERVTVDGVLIPADRQDLIKYVLKRALKEPNEMWEEEVNGIKYVRMWWD